MPLPQKLTTSSIMTDQTRGRNKKVNNCGAESIEPLEGISVKDAGQRGGRATLESQGADFFRRIGKKGGQRTKELYGDLLSKFGKKGGRPKRPNLEDMGGENR